VRCRAKEDAWTRYDAKSLQVWSVRGVSRFVRVWENFWLSYDGLRSALARVT
jgi:hypothetical protein